jgi:hypothetical protein
MVRFCSTYMLNAVPRKKSAACRFQEAPAPENTKRRFTKKLNTMPVDVDVRFERITGTPRRRSAPNTEKSITVFATPTSPNLTACRAERRGTAVFDTIPSTRRKLAQDDDRKEPRTRSRNRSYVEPVRMRVFQDVPDRLRD